MRNGSPGCTFDAQLRDGGVLLSGPTIVPHAVVLVRELCSPPELWSTERKLRGALASHGVRRLLIRRAPRPSVEAFKRRNARERVGALRRLAPVGPIDRGAESLGFRRDQLAIAATGVSLSPP